jgi:anti-anti-sigma factor
MTVNPLPSAPSTEEAEPRGDVSWISGQSHQVDGGASDLLSAVIIRGEGRAVLRLRGELDLEGVEVFDAVLAQLEDEPVLVVDLSELEFMDSTGLDCLLRLRQHVASAGDALTLTSPQRRVARLMALAGVAGLFRLEEPT